MIRGGFLDPSMRADLIALMRDGKAETRLTRRANALVLLDDGMSCEAIAKVLYLDDDTIRYWYALYAERGPSWLADFGYKGRACELTAAQQDDLKEWVAQTLPRTTARVGEWIETRYGVSYTRSTLIKLMGRIGVEYRKPKVMPRKLDPAKQQAFIDGYENLLNNLDDDEAVMFADALHPTHKVRPAGCWAPKEWQGRARPIRRAFSFGCVSPWKSPERLGDGRKIREVLISCGFLKLWAGFFACNEP